MMASIEQQLMKARMALAPVAKGNAALEARLLAAHAWDMSHEALVLYGQDTRDEAALDALVARRVEAEPVAQILGQKDFWKHTFFVSPDVLTPRPDSETMIETRQRDIGRVAVGFTCTIIRSAIGRRLLVTWLARLAGHAGLVLVARELARLWCLMASGLIGIAPLIVVRRLLGWRMLRSIGVIRPTGDDLRFAGMGKALRLDGGNIRQHAGVVVHMLQVILDIHPVAVDLGVARHVAILTQLLGGVVLLALQVLAVIGAAAVITPATVVVVAACAATAMLIAAITVIVLAHHVVHRSFAFVVSGCYCWLAKTTTRAMPARSFTISMQVNPCAVPNAATSAAWPTPTSNSMSAPGFTCCGNCCKMLR
jgi:hypothetical protein